MNKFKKSQELFDEELKYLPGGTTSNARLWHNVCPTDMPCAIFAKKAKGAYLWDVDNNKYIDYRLGYGPIILGHAYPKVLNAVKKVMKDGEVFALNNELELKLAKKINKAVKCAEMIRYANSGTEATMTAVRVARAFTKKDKILKFEGHYHGHHDYVLFSLAKHIKSDLGKKPINASLGIPNSIRNLVFAEEWNDFDNVEKTIKRHHKEIACIICEPVTGNSAVIPPEPGFLNHLRELCNKYNIVLILVESKLVSSKSEAKRILDHGGVKIDAACPRNAHGKGNGAGYLSKWIHYISPCGKVLDDEAFIALSEQRMVLPIRA